MDNRHERRRDSRVGIDGRRVPACRLDSACTPFSRVGEGGRQHDGVVVVARCPCNRRVLTAQQAPLDLSGGDGGNIVVPPGADGIVFVDSGPGARAGEVVRAVPCTAGRGPSTQPAARFAEELYNRPAECGWDGSNPGNDGSSRDVLACVTREPPR